MKQIVYSLSLSQLNKIINRGRTKVKENERVVLMNQSPQHDLIIQYNVSAMQNTKGPNWSSCWKIFISFSFASLRQNLVPFTIPHSCSQLPIPLDYLHHYLLLIIYLKRKPQLKIMEPKEERERDCLDHEEKERTINHTSNAPS